MVAELKIDEPIADLRPAFNPTVVPEELGADSRDVTGHIVFLRPSHGSARRDLSSWSASEMHRDVNGRDRILTRVGTGSIPERGKQVRTPGKSGRARV